MMGYFRYFIVLGILLCGLPVWAHTELSERRLESDLAKLSVRLGKIETRLRALTGQVEETEHRVRREQKKSIENQRKLIGSLKRDITRLKQALRQSASRSSVPRKGIVSDSGRLNLSKKTPDALYNHAIDQLVVKKNYKKAQATFEAFIRQYPDNDKAGQALYWLGESFYVRGNYRDAAQAYLQSFNSYGSGTKAADSLLKLGMSLAALHEWEESCAAFGKLRSTFPSAPPRILQRLETEYERIQCGSDNPRG